MTPSGAHALLSASLLVAALPVSGEQRTRSPTDPPNPSEYASVEEIERNRAPRPIRGDYEMVDSSSRIRVRFDTAKMTEHGVKASCLSVQVFRLKDGHWEPIPSGDSITPRPDCREWPDRLPHDVTFDLEALGIENTRSVRVEILDSEHNQRRTTRLDPRRLGCRARLTFPVLFVKHRGAGSADTETAGTSEAASSPSAGAESGVWNWTPSVGASYGWECRRRSTDGWRAFALHHLAPGAGFNATVIGSSLSRAPLRAIGINREAGVNGFGVGAYLSLFGGRLTFTAGRELANGNHDWYGGIGTTIMTEVPGFLRR